MKKIWEFVGKLKSNDTSILFLRLAIGIVFIHAGWIKMQNADMLVESFLRIGIVPILSYALMFFEFVCGIAMILGVFVNYAGSILAFVMLIAIIKVHWRNGIWIQNGGYEYVLVLLLVALSIAVSGAGKYSLSYWMKKRKESNSQQQSLPI